MPMNRLSRVLTPADVAIRELQIAQQKENTRKEALVKEAINNKGAASSLQYQYGGLVTTSGMPGSFNAQQYEYGNSMFFADTQSIWPTGRWGATFGDDVALFRRAADQSAQARSGATTLVEEPKPSMDMLERTCLAVQNLDLEEPRTSLALEAETLLGYRPLRKEMKADPPLKRTLAKLEMEVLVASTVDKYKAMMVAHLRTTKQMGDPTWNMTELQAYGQPVPEFVLAKCVEIKRELPTAKFFVEQLREDPFMLVGLKEESYYLEVWDEPRFEANFGQRLIE